MKLYILSLIFALLATFALPNNSQAYGATNKTATDLGNGTALFTVTYKFGFLNREVYLPILASRNKEFTDKGAQAGYSILINDINEAKATTTKMKADGIEATINYSILPGKAKAIVLSGAMIKDGRYYLPKGKSGDFTLIALVNMSNSSSTNDIALQMTSLPFTMVDDGKLIEAALNPSELQYFKTPEIDLKK